MNVTLRIATPADASALLAIHEACCADLTRCLGPGHWSLAPTPASLLATMERRTVYVALADGAPAATVTSGVRPAAFWPARVWAEPMAAAQCVFGLAVRPDLQRRGIGTWTMREMEFLAARCGRRWVRLDAYALNPRSMGFYRALGYQSRGELTVNGVRLVCFEKHVSEG